jgi:dihydroflavonol-4-reductase
MPAAMKVLVVGGTGLIGYHAVKALLGRGHQVTVVAKRCPVFSPLFPSAVSVNALNIDTTADGELAGLLRGHDGAVFAAGADDRITPRAPAGDFFYDANVKSAARFFLLARGEGVRHGVLLGSYFSYFDRTWPQMRLSYHHPYIHSRKMQALLSFEAAAPDLALSVLELPYVFGATPGRIPLWEPLIRYVRAPAPLFSPAGGINAIAVTHVGEAVAGAIERAGGGQTYTIGEENLLWKDLLERLSRKAGKVRTVHILPSAALKVLTMSAYWRLRIRGRESGLNLMKLPMLLAARTFFDASPSRMALGYGAGGLDQALDETVTACRLPRGMGANNR